MALTEEEKKKAIELYNKQKKLSQNSKKSGPTEPKMTKEEAAKSTKEQNKKVKQDAKKEKEIMAGRTDHNLYKTEAKPKTETEVTPKKTTNNATGKAQQFSTIANKPASFSAKAISSEAEKKPMSATQYGKTQLSNQIYDKYRTAEEYYNNPYGNSLEKGLVNRLRSAGGETVENVAYFLQDNLAPETGYTAGEPITLENRDAAKRSVLVGTPLNQFLYKNAENVVAKNQAGQIGDLADQQIMQAKENTGAFGDFLIDTADAGANMASQAILAGVLLPGAPTPVANKVFSGVQGVSAGAQKYVDTREAGGSKAEAFQRGIGSGAIATITEGLTGIGKTGVSKIPGVDRIVTHLDEFATKNWLTNVLSTGLGEGGEEGLEYAFEYASDVIADLIYKGEIETDFNVAELFQNVASGFVLGAGFGSVGGTTNAYQNYTPKTETDVSAEAPVAPVEPPVIETENVTPKVQNAQESAFANAVKQSKAEEQVNPVNVQANSANDVIKVTETQQTVEEKIVQPDGETENPITEQKVKEAAEILEETPQEILQEKVPDKELTEEAKKEIDKKLLGKLNANAKKNLDAIGNGEFLKENIVFKGNVPGFNDLQRAVIVNQLLTNKTKGIIDIKIPNDGELEVNNDPLAVAALLDQLKVSIDTNSDAELSKNAEAALKKSERIAHFKSNGKDYLTNGFFAIRTNESGKDKIFKSYPKAYIESDRDIFKAFDGVEAQEIATNPKEITHGKEKFYVFSTDNGDYVFNKSYVDLVDGGKMFIGEHGAVGAYIKVLDNNGNITGLVLSLNRASTGTKNLVEEAKTKSVPAKLKSFSPRKKSPTKKKDNSGIWEEAEKYSTQPNSHPNTVGAAQSNPASYAHLQNEHGVFEPGEQPLARDPNVPLKDAQGNRVSQSVRTIMEAKVTPDELIPAFEKEVAAGTFENKGTTNKEAVEKAAVRIANKSFKDAVSDFETLYSDDKLLSKDDLVFGEMLFSMAAQNGEADTAMKIASLLSSNNSRTGDAMQAQRILKRLSPEGRLYHAQRITEKFNKDKHQKNEIKLSEETVKKVLNAKTDEEIEAANDAVAEDIAKQIDRGFFNDIAGIVNAWRYFSMLGNPKTHIRNFFGNVAFLPARKIKNVVKAGIESIAYKAGWIDEKTATVKLASKENREFAKKSFEKNKKALLQGGNYRFESEIDSKIEPFRFSGKETPVKKFFNAVLTPARKAAEFNSNALEAEDVLFLKNAYIDSFTQYLTANKIDAQNITPEQKTKAENYAAAEAAKATYRDYSAISSALEKLANTTIPIGKDKKALEIYGIKVKPFKFLVEANIPFRKTPINVLARGIEYSPVGLAKALAVDGYLLKKGDITANEMIDHISSGLTGSGVVVLGVALALKGVLTAGEKEDKNEQAFDELQGKQNYALNIGDGSYTIDWLSPTAIPLFIGAEAVQAAKEEYGDNPKWEQIVYSLLKNLDTIADPILELSMLDNLNKLLSGNYGKDGSAIAGLMKDSATSYVLQLIPTLSSQIAQTIDGTRRNAYYVDKTDNISDDWQVLIQRAKAKIPGLSKELPAYIDAWGREQKQSENIGVRIVENFLSPGYYKKRNVTEVDEMLKQLYADTGESSVLPSNFAKSFKVDGENLNLSGKQYVDAQKKKGQTAYNMLNQLIADKDFKKLSSEQKASIVSDVYSYANVKGKQEVSNYATDTKWYKNIEEAKSKHGISNADYLIAKNHYSNLDGDNKKAKMLDQLIADKGTSAKQDVALMEYIAGVDMSKYKKATSEPSKQLALYKIKNDATKGKENDLEQIQKEFKEDVYGAREIYYKSEGDWNYNIDDVIDNGKNRDKKVSVYKKFGLSEEDIVTGYNATIGYNKKEDLMAALTDAFGSKKKATTFYNILKGKKGYK